MTHDALDLGDHLLSLLGDKRPGDALGDAILMHASSELGLRIGFEIAGEPVIVEVALLEEGRPHAARSRRLAFAYRSGDAGHAVPAHVGQAICRAVAALASDHEDRVLAAIATEASRAREADEGGARVREVNVARLLEPAGDPAAPYYTLSPYVGCLVGCRFCYAQGRVGGVRRLEQLPPAPWGSYVDARINAAEILAREIASLPPLPIKFCPIVSDPYQAVEARYRITRACLEILRDAPPRPTLLLTRCRLIERDTDLLVALPGAYAGVSIPTIDDDVRRHFEPRAAPIGERLAILRALRDAGIRTFAVVQPLLPGDLEALADALAASARSVSIDVLHGTEGASEDFADPRFSTAREPRWQEERAAALRTALIARGVRVWDGELPPDYIGHRGRNGPTQ